MNNVHNPQPGQQEEKKTAVIKTLAIIGFIAALIIGVWLAVQIVRFIPDAFSSLASLLDGIQNSGDAEFTIAADEDLVNVGEVLTVSWTMLRADGEYVFSYECVDGTAAEMRTNANDFMPIACEREITLPTDSNNATFAFYSEKERFTDIRYTVAFLPEDNETIIERERVVTVINPDISTRGNSDERPIVDGDDTDEPRDDETPTTPSQPTGYITVPRVVTSYPASNPNGYSDLAVTFIGVGTYEKSKDRFYAANELEEGEDGAIRFEVRNIGTKTSGSWYFSAELPTDPEFTYSSRAQSGLRPNEFEIITLRFDNVTDKGNKNIRIRVNGGNDTNISNNSINPRIRIED